MNYFWSGVCLPGVGCLAPALSICLAPTPSPYPRRGDWLIVGGGPSSG